MHHELGRVAASHSYRTVRWVAADSWATHLSVIAPESMLPPPEVKDHSSRRLPRVPSLLSPSADLVLLIAGPLSAYALLVVPGFRFEQLDPLRTIGTLFATLVVVEWVVVAFAMLCDARGQEYVQGLGTKEFSRARLEERAHSLSIAGLVFAASVFLDQSSRPREVVELLEVSAIAYLVSWITGFQTHRRSSAILSDGLQWVALAALLATMATVVPSAPIQFVVDLSLLLLVVYSWENARGYLIEAGLISPNARAHGQEQAA